ncbi:uncharacterized protein LOC128186817 isoform X2 [Crassostrea angulata]|uniref:uncharacterized protein LOC128186817 isoform X2 n=1 Tax=Magallana angulata TaxID=2784310 RepID=UPI0022B1CB69|nr:uncharacterized protein LOC128186817 isoform X2 [Crassostrea angulata]
MLVSGITSFMLLFVLLLQTDAKPTSALRQKRAPGFQFPRLGRLQEYKFDSSPDIYVEEIEPVLNDDIIDSFLRGQNDLSPQDRYQESEVNKRGIQFPRLGRKRSSLADMHTYREYAEKMLNSADDDFPHDIREKLLSMLHSDDEGPTNRIIII